MKGFIEVHDFNDGNEVLVAIGNINSMRAEIDEDGTFIHSEGYRVNIVRETYDEVKALIAEAQSDVDLKDYIPKKRLEEWLKLKRENMESGEPFDAYLFNMLSIFITDLNMFLGKEDS